MAYLTKICPIMLSCYPIHNFSIVIIEAPLGQSKRMSALYNFVPNAADIIDTEESELELIDPKTYPWPSIDIVVFLTQMDADVEIQKDLLLLLTDEEEDPYVEHFQEKNGKFIQVTERYTGWRAGKLIWQQFWWEALREESANDYGVDADKLPATILEYLGGNAPPKLGRGFRGTTLERHVENCMLAAWLGKDRYRREILGMWPDIEYEFQLMVKDNNDKILRRHQLGKRLSDLLGIRPSKVEALVESFFRDLKENDGNLPADGGPGNHFLQRYRKEEKKWKREWEVRISLVEQIVGPDVYWQTDFHMFGEEIDENESKYLLEARQTDVDTHWGTLTISYNPFVAVWESLREEGTEPKMVRIFDCKDPSALDELLYLNLHEVPNNELLNNTLLKKAMTKTGLKGKDLRERILARRKLRLRIRSLHQKKIPLKVDRGRRKKPRIGTLRMLPDHKSGAMNGKERETPRIEKQLLWAAPGKIQHIKRCATDLNFEYSFELEGKGNILNFEQLRIKREALDDPDNETVSQLDFLGRNEELMKMINVKSDGGISYKEQQKTSINREVYKWRKIETEYLNSRRHALIKATKNLEGRKKSVLSYHFYWQVYEEAANDPITITNVSEIMLELKRKLKDIGDQALYTRIFEQNFMLKKLQNVCRRLLALKKYHEKWWFVFWFHHRILQLRLCDRWKLPHSIVRLKPHSTPFEKIPWKQVGRTIDMNALSAIYDKYIESWYRTAKVPAGEKKPVLRPMQSEVKSIAAKLVQFKALDEKRAFEETFFQDEDGVWRKVVDSQGREREEIVTKESVQRVIPKDLYQKYFNDAEVPIDYTSPQCVAVEKTKLAKQMDAVAYSLIIAVISITRGTAGIYSLSRIDCFAK
ncbi:hypothetical protein AAMO2058_000088500 [Amorphochlora amoebiformis]